MNNNNNNNNNNNDQGAAARMIVAIATGAIAWNRRNVQARRAATMRVNRATAAHQTRLASIRTHVTAFNARQSRSARAAEHSSRVAARALQAQFDAEAPEVIVIDDDDEDDDDDDDDDDDNAEEDIGGAGGSYDYLDLVEMTEPWYRMIMAGELEAIEPYQRSSLARQTAIDWYAAILRDTRRKTPQQRYSAWLSIAHRFDNTRWLL